MENSSCLKTLKGSILNILEKAIPLREQCI
jgi:hypothetical protein